MQGFGRIKREENEPVFHARWEGRVQAMMIAGLRLGLYNLDEYRWALERMDPAAYLHASYYEKRLAAIERLYVEKGVITQDELDSRLRQPHSIPPSRGDPAIAERLLHSRPSQPRGGSDHPSHFTVGDQVVAKNTHPQGHTRLPRYVRGKRGVIERLHGSYVLPDKNAMGLGQDLEYVYSVRFKARDLWGKDVSVNDRVYIDLWESYLERAT
jgi:nitrile hydratase